MGDGQSHGYRAAEERRKRAWKRLGSLSEDELDALGDRLTNEANAARKRAREAEEEARRAEAELDEVWAVIRDRLDGRQPPT